MITIYYVQDQSIPVYCEFRFTGGQFGRGAGFRRPKIVRCIVWSGVKKSGTARHICIFIDYVIFNGSIFTGAAVALCSGAAVSSDFVVKTSQCSRYFGPVSNRCSSGAAVSSDFVFRFQ